MPRNTALCNVTGAPIIVSRKPDFTEEDVKELQARFYAELDRTIARHQAQYPRYRGVRVRYVDPAPRRRPQTESNCS